MNVVSDDAPVESGVKPGQEDSDEQLGESIPPPSTTSLFYSPPLAFVLWKTRMVG